MTADAPVRLLWFAALRERMGTAEETVTPPADVRTLGALLAWLRGRDARTAAALAEPRLIRGAVNQQFARDDTPVAPGDEVAFFPPVTGG